MRRVLLTLTIHWRNKKPRERSGGNCYNNGRLQSAIDLDLTKVEANMARRYIKASKGLLKVQDAKILDTLARHGAATPLQVEVRAGLIGVDVASRIETLQHRGLVTAHSSAYGNDKATHNIYTLSPIGRERLRQTKRYTRIGKGGETPISTKNYGSPNRR